MFCCGQPSNMLLIIIMPVPAVGLQVVHMGLQGLLEASAELAVPGMWQRVEVVG